jgi:hypothetical protein
VEEDFLQRSRVTQQSLFLTRDCKHEEMRGRMPLGRKKWKRENLLQLNKWITRELKYLETCCFKWGEIPTLWVICVHDNPMDSIGK